MSFTLFNKNQVNGAQRVSGLSGLKFLPLVLSVSMLTGCLTAKITRWEPAPVKNSAVSVADVKTSYAYMTTSGTQYNTAKEEQMRLNIQEALESYFKDKGYSYQTLTVAAQDKAILDELKDWSGLSVYAKADLVDAWNYNYGPGTSSLIAQFTKDRPVIKTTITSKGHTLDASSKYLILIRAHYVESSAGFITQNILKTIGAVATLGVSTIITEFSNETDANKEVKKTPYLSMIVIDNQTNELVYSNFDEYLNWPKLVNPEDKKALKKQIYNELNAYFEAK